MSLTRILALALFAGSTIAGDVTLTLTLFYGEGCTGSSTIEVIDYALGSGQTVLQLDYTFQSAQYSGGTYPDDVYGCQYGYSCYDNEDSWIAPVIGDCSQVTSSDVNLDKLLIVSN